MSRVEIERRGRRVVSSKATANRGETGLVGIPSFENRRARYLRLVQRLHHRWEREFCRAIPLRYEVRSPSLLLKRESLVPKGKGERNQRRPRLKGISPTHIVRLKTVPQSSRTRNCGGKTSICESVRGFTVQAKRYTEFPCGIRSGWPCRRFGRSDPWSLVRTRYLIVMWPFIAIPK